MAEVDDLFGAIVDRLARLEARVHELSLLETPDALTPSDWASWTPTLTQVGAITFTLHHAAYKVLDKIAHVQVRLGITNAGTAGTGIVIAGQPAAIQPAAETLVGTFLLLDAGTAYYIGNIRAVTATNWQMFAHGQASSVGASPNFALASGDVLYFQGAYEVP